MSDSVFVQGDPPLTHSLDVSTPIIPVENGDFNFDDYFVCHDWCRGNIRLISPEPTRNANASHPEAQPSTETINPADLTTPTTPEWSPSLWDFSDVNANLMATMNTFSGTHEKSTAVADTGTQASRKRRAKSRSTSSSIKRQNRLPLGSVTILDDWLTAHKENPYPTPGELQRLVERSSLTRKQVSTWFNNARSRKLQQTPMELYASSSSDEEAAKEEDIRRAVESMPDLYRSSSRISQETTGYAASASSSSAASAFDQYPEAHLSRPARQGRRKYGRHRSYTSRCASSADSASSVGSLHSPRSPRGPLVSTSNDRATVVLRDNDAYDFGNHLFSDEVEPNRKEQKQSDSTMNRISSRLGDHFPSFSRLRNHRSNIVDASLCISISPCPPSTRSSSLASSTFQGPDQNDASPASPSRKTSAAGTEGGIDDCIDPAPPKKLQTVFQCTFCRIPLREKSWKRHEESLHFNRCEWVCMPFDRPTTIRMLAPDHCVFCNTWFTNTIDDQHDCHRISDCLARSRQERTFQRKDKLVQHLNQFHGVKAVRGFVLNAWRRRGKDKNWQCGFCGQMLANWDERARHISKHFRDGYDMDDWMLAEASGVEGDCGRDEVEG